MGDFDLMRPRVPMLGATASTSFRCQLRLGSCRELSIQIGHALQSRRLGSQCTGCAALKGFQCPNAASCALFLSALFPVLTFRLCLRTQAVSSFRVAIALE